MLETESSLGFQKPFLAILDYLQEVITLFEGVFGRKFRQKMKKDVRQTVG